MLTNQTKQSHLFTLRLWSQEDEDGRIQWRGQIHHINNDDMRYFQDWAALIPLLLAMLRTSKSESEESDNTTFSSPIQDEGI